MTNKATKIKLGQIPVSTDTPPKLEDAIEKAEPFGAAQAESLAETMGVEIGRAIAYFLNYVILASIGVLPLGGLVMLIGNLLQNIGFLIDMSWLQAFSVSGLIMIIAVTALTIKRVFF